MQVAFRAVGGMLDLSFLLGPSLADVISQYTEVVGRPMVPPYWALGYHLCRWGYGSAAATAKVADTMRLAGVSQDAQWNDIDHMQMAHDFTLDPLTFRAGAMIAMIDSLHANNQRYVPIVDPAIASSPRGAYPPLDEVNPTPPCPALPYRTVPYPTLPYPTVAGRVWPGGTYFPDFFHPAAGEYWAAQLRQFRTLLAFDGIWLDMNEPSNFCDGPCAALEKCENAGTGAHPRVGVWGLGFRVPCEVAGVIRDLIPPTFPSKRRLTAPIPYGRRLKLGGIRSCSRESCDVHNLYGLSETILTSEALVALTAEQRPFVITRSTFPGSGRFAGHWLGDNRATWTDMKESIPGMLTMGLLGIPLVGADVCGFAGATTRELCIRWTQLGAFYPFMRNHNDNVAPAQEPTAWDVEALGMMRYTLNPGNRALSPTP
ncbi:family 31 glycoside hydrolase [Baffinella frigidus]|nr:family 31 glycoside hydrolase [Cryptophyta sp. CCMP2293]